MKRTNFNESKIQLLKVCKVQCVIHVFINGLCINNFCPIIFQFSHKKVSLRKCIKSYKIFTWRKTRRAKSIMAITKIQLVYWNVEDRIQSALWFAKLNAFTCITQRKDHQLKRNSQRVLWWMNPLLYSLLIKKHGLRGLSWCFRMCDILI